MADRKAVKSGNWSDTTVWDGGTLPVPGDIVMSNNFTVTIDMNITVLNLRNDAWGGATHGGSFVCNGLITINATTVAAGIVTCLTLIKGTLNGNVQGGFTTSALGAILQSGATLNGNSQGGTSANCTGVALESGSKQIGNSTGGSNATAYGSTLKTGAIQKGNSQGGTAHGTVCLEGGFHVGNATGGSISGAAGTYVAAGGFFSGIATGGTASNTNGCTIVNGGIAIVEKAKGISTGVGVVTSGDFNVCVIKEEEGANPKTIGAGTNTTYLYVPFAERPAAVDIATAVWARAGRELTA